MLSDRCSDSEAGDCKPFGWDLQSPLGTNSQPVINRPLKAELNQLIILNNRNCKRGVGMFKAIKMSLLLSTNLRNQNLCIISQMQDNRQPYLPLS